MQVLERSIELFFLILEKTNVDVRTVSLTVCLFVFICASIGFFIGGPSENTLDQSPDIENRMICIRSQRPLQRLMASSHDSGNDDAKRTKVGTTEEKDVKYDEPPKCSNVINGYIPISETIPRSGAFGLIRKIYRMHDNPDVVFALKTPKDDHPETLDNFDAEINAYAELKDHANIVKFIYGVSDGPLQYPFIVLEWMEYSLRDYIATCGGVIPNPREMFVQVASGLDHMHTHHLMHRDLKTANVLVDSTGTRAKISDFGSTRKYSKERNNTVEGVCTIWYRAPEISLRDVRYTLAVDIWSLGCIHYELYHGSPPFRSQLAEDYDQLIHIFKTIGTPPHLAFPTGAFPPWPKLLSWKPCPMLSFDPSLRPSTPLECIL